MVMRTSIFSIERNIINNKLQELTASLENGKHLGQSNDIMKYISSFSKKLDYTDFIGLHIDILCEIFNKERPSYDAIDKVLSSLLTELVYEGHSMRYLFKWGLTTFIHEFRDFNAKINSVRALGSRNERKFEIYFKLSFPKKEFYETPGLDITFLRENTHEKTAIAEFLSDATKEKAVVNIDAVDMFDALEKARDKLLNTLLLSNLLEPNTNYNPNIAKEILIYDVTKEVLTIEKYEENISPKIRLSNLQCYFLASSKKNNTDTKESLARALHWCRVANYSPDEGKFLALWSVFEYLLSGHSDKIIQLIVRFFIPFSGLYYCKRKVTLLQDLMKDDNGTEYKVLTETISKEFRQRNLRLGDFFNYVYNNAGTIEATFEDNDLLLRKLRWVSGCLSDRKILVNSINGLEQKISSDLLRMYRLRNMLAHRAHVEEKTLESNLRWLVFYLQVLLENLLYIFEKRSDFTIEEILLAKEQSYQNYKNKLNSYLHPSIDYKQVVLPEDLLI
jgi:hypothetical protein